MIGNLLFQVMETRKNAYDYPANFSYFGTLIRDINLVSDLNKTWKDIK